MRQDELFAAKEPAFGLVAEGHALADTYEA